MPHEGAKQTCLSTTNHGVRRRIADSNRAAKHPASLCIIDDMIRHHVQDALAMTGSASGFLRSTRWCAMTCSQSEVGTLTGSLEDKA